MNEIRNAIKLHLPLLHSLNHQGRQPCAGEGACEGRSGLTVSSPPAHTVHLRPARHAGFLQKTTAAVSGMLLAALLMLAAPVLAGELEAYPEVGPTPPLVLKDLGGNTHTLDDYRGQVVLLNFWATWCTPCLIEMPAMQRLKAAFADTAFTIVAVNVKESRERVWRFQKLLDVHFTVLLDTNGQAAQNWDVAVYPTSYLIDRTGHIRYMAYGALDWDSTAVKQVIETLQEENQQPLLTTTSN